ncbi:MAG: type IV pilus assembly protein PilM [Candidatus Geothermincolia bacterium]
MSPKKATTAVGLDIATDSVKIAELQISSRTQPILTNVGIVNLPPGAVRDGEIEDGAIVADAIRQLIEGTGIKQRHVILGLANQKVIVRPIELPYMESDELKSALQFQVQEFIPIPVEDALVDFDIIEEFMTGEDQRMLSVLLVAAYREMVQSYIDTLKVGGLTAVAIDLKVFALTRSLLLHEFAAIPEMGEEPEAVCIINIGAGITNMVIVKAGVPRFARILMRGGDDFTRSLMDRLDVDAAEAEEFKLGLAASEEASNLIRQEIMRFVNEIRRSLDYFVTQTQERNLRRIVVSGNGSRILNFPQELSAALRLPVEIGRPFQNVQLGQLAYGPEELAEMEPALAVAVGLALREVME